MSEDMSPYCSGHDEWLIMKLCMYVRYHTANNVSNFGGDPVTQFNLKKRFKNLIRVRLHSRDAITVFAAVATRTRADCSSMEDCRCKSLYHQINNTIKWPYQPKHSPSSVLKSRNFISDAV